MIHPHNIIVSHTAILEQQVSQLSAERDQLKHQLSVLSFDTTGM